MWGEGGASLFLNCVQTDGVLFLLGAARGSFSGMRRCQLATKEHEISWAIRPKE